MPTTHGLEIPGLVPD